LMGRSATSELSWEQRFRMGPLRNITRQRSHASTLCGNHTVGYSDGK
jgi:hypothetical protein